MNKPKEFQFKAMTTQCSIQCYGLTDKSFSLLASRIHTRVNELVEKYNFHSEASWLNRKVNARETNRIRIDPELANILGTVRYHSAISGNVFDITVGTYSHKLKHTKTVKAANKIKLAALDWVGEKHWSIEGSNLYFSNPHTRFDLGGVIKEYAVDISLIMSQEAGASAALVNYGGDIRSFGRKPNGQRFVSAISNPKEPMKVLFGLDLENQALTTSGHYARKFALTDGELSHVVSNGASPTPSPSHEHSEPSWSSVSVVAPSALVSGIYSTSLLIKRNASLAPKIFAIAVDEKNQIHQLTAPQATSNSHRKNTIPTGGIQCV